MAGRPEQRQPVKGEHGRRNAAHRQARDDVPIHRARHAVHAGADRLGRRRIEKVRPDRGLGVDAEE